MLKPLVLTLLLSLTSISYANPEIECKYYNNGALTFLEKQTVLYSSSSDIDKEYQLEKDGQKEITLRLLASQEMLELILSVDGVETSTSGLKTDSAIVKYKNTFVLCQLGPVII